MMGRNLCLGMVYSALLGGIVVCGAGVVRAEEPPPPPLPEHTIHRAAGPIDVDGVLDEPSWQASEPITEFTSPWHEDGAPRGTEARLLWDEQFLYVAFVVEDEDVTAHYTERDDAVSQEDCVEIFVAPDHGAVELYYNFEFNALGTILDRTTYKDQGLDWNTDGIQVAITYQGTINDDTDVDEGWTAEIAIPFAAFAGVAPNLPPRDGESWRLNLYRLNDRGGRQYTLWSHTLTEQPNFHVPERFGIVHFSALPVRLADARVEQE